METGEKGEVGASDTKPARKYNQAFDGHSGEAWRRRNYLYGAALDVSDEVGHLIGLERVTVILLREVLCWARVGLELVVLVALRRNSDVW